MGGVRTPESAWQPPSPSAQPSAAPAPAPLSLLPTLSALQRFQFAREAPVESWLAENQQLLAGSQMASLVARIRREIGTDQAGSLSDPEIESVVRRYAGARDITVGALIATTPGAPSAVNLGPALLSLSEALEAIPTEVGVETERGWALVKFGGPTVGLQRDRFRIGSTIGWDGELGLEADFENLRLGDQLGNLSFRGTLSQEKWSMALGFRIGQEMPVLSDLRNTFIAGEQSLRNIAVATATMDDPIQAAGAIGEHVEPLKKAATAATQIGGAQPGASFGLSLELSSRPPEAPATAPPIGFTPKATFTYIF